MLFVSVLRNPGFSSQFSAGEWPVLVFSKTTTVSGVWALEYARDEVDASALVSEVVRRAAGRREESVVSWLDRLAPCEPVEDSSAGPCDPHEEPAPSLDREEVQDPVEIPLS